MKVEIISVGTEVLTGDIIDTNAPYISKGLGSIGAEVIRRTTVGDEAEAMLDALKSASEKADVIITIGGFGPTYDDFTKYEVAEFLGKKLIYSEEVAGNLAEYFEKVGRKMTENNLRQAYVFEDGEVIQMPDNVFDGADKNDLIGKDITFRIYEKDGSAGEIIAEISDEDGNKYLTFDEYNQKADDIRILFAIIGGILALIICIGVLSLW